MNPRRKFILQSSALTAVSAFSTLDGMGLMNAFAQSAPASDYKALVCVFLFGGNDGNNTVVPRDTEAYNAYAAARGGPSSAGGLAISQSSLVPVNPRSQAAGFGLHPALSAFKPIWEAGKLAVLANVGALVEPVTRADYVTGRKTVPQSLFSHSDQQAQWQSSISDRLSATGWGGRLADATRAFNGSSTLPMITSVSGSPLFSVGTGANVVAIPASGTFGLNGFNNSAYSANRLGALKNLLLLTSGNRFVSEADDVFAQAIDAANVMNPVITATSSTVTAAFAGVNSPIASQLQQVAKLIEARGTLGLKRQIFFVSLGGFDTHSAQINDQDNLFAQLGPAIKAFYDATVALGVANQVTTFTMSDFGRTLKPASGGGSDHAWGSHHFIIGGAVRGGDLYGTFPTLVLNGPDDASFEGRWIPTTSVDQYAATLATWYGVRSEELLQVVPNIGRFATPNLGFLS
jgi:uncharacterized protein (DUF1501 family)